MILVLGTSDELCLDKVKKESLKVLQTLEDYLEEKRLTYKETSDLDIVFSKNRKKYSLSVVEEPTLHIILSEKHKHSTTVILMTIETKEIEEVITSL